jgi:hypothetical protein
MCLPDQIGDDEIVYRKISVNSTWYDPVRREVKPEAFKPRPGDEGLSVDRAKSDLHQAFRSVEEAAVGQAGKRYYVASLRVGDLREHGIEVVPKSLAENPGHAEIINLTYENRKTDASAECMTLLAHKLVRDVEGPFPVE